ncbi:MAG: hypothetical protein HOM07_18430 [Rhodospirillaceae bacterium]|jgi:adenylate cyclase|nr:hypothetical protein [Rhodospirillaceae bacterium]
MAEQSIQRRLVAILAADVEGYSRLMGADEAATVTALRGARKITDRLIGAHAGRIANTAGDSIIAVFDSAVEAVRTAAAIQAELAPLNAEFSEDRQIRFRIGVNLGDVILDGDDVLGDGVNIAARLEGLAEPGGICISRNIYDQVSDKLHYRYDYIGEQAVKNIAQPVRAYRILAAGSAQTEAPDPSSNAAKSKWARTAGLVVAAALILAGAGWYWQSSQTASPTAAKSGAERAALSILVLPFANGTGDPAQAYIADGLTASITSDLSRIRDAFVVAARTAFTYKGKPIDLQQIGMAQGVRFVLQGSVQRGGDKIRINAQLADTRSNAQLWAETFEGNSANLFALQDQVTARIGNSIGREMVVLAARENETRIANPKAANFILRAKAAFLKPQSLKNLQRIEGWYHQALERDPRNASAMADLALVLSVQAFNFRRKLTPDAREKKFAEGREYALKAKELDPGNPRIYSVLALYASTHNDFPAQRRATETYLRLDPKSPMAYNFEANTQIYLGNYQKAIAFLDQGSALDPKHPHVLLAVSYFRAYFLAGDNDATIEWAQRALELNPRFSESHVFLAMAYALKGDDAKAREAVANLAQANPKFKLTNFRKPQSSRPAAHNDAYSMKILPAGRKAGLPE